MLANAQDSLLVWHDLQATNNRIDSEHDHNPGLNCAFDDNSLETQDDVGMLLAQQAKIIGNFARNDFRLFVAGVNPENFGNGAMNVVPVVNWSRRFYAAVTPLGNLIRGA